MRHNPVNCLEKRCDLLRKDFEKVMGLTSIQIPQPPLKSKNGPEEDIDKLMCKEDTASTASCPVPPKLRSLPLTTDSKFSTSEEKPKDKCPDVMVTKNKCDKMEMSQNECNNVMTAKDTHDDTAKAKDKGNDCEITKDRSDSMVIVKGKNDKAMMPEENKCHAVTAKDKCDEVMSAKDKCDEVMTAKDQYDEVITAKDKRDEAMATEGKCDHMRTLEDNNDDVMTAKEKYDACDDAMIVDDKCDKTKTGQDKRDNLHTAKVKRDKTGSSKDTDIKKKQEGENSSRLSTEANILGKADELKESKLRAERTHQEKEKMLVSEAEYFFLKYLKLYYEVRQLEKELGIPEELGVNSMITTEVPYKLK